MQNFQCQFQNMIICSLRLKIFKIIFIWTIYLWIHWYISHYSSSVITLYNTFILTFDFCTCNMFHTSPVLSMSILPILLRFWYNSGGGNLDTAQLLSLYITFWETHCLISIIKWPLNLISESDKATRVKTQNYNMFWINFQYI